MFSFCKVAVEFNLIENILLDVTISLQIFSLKFFMEYIKSAFASFKQRKLLSVFLLCVLLLTVFFKSIIDKIYIYLDDGYDRQSAQLVEMMDSLLGIPYYQEPFYRNDSVDIIKLSKEEWYTFPDPKAGRNRERIKLAEGEYPLPIKDSLGKPLYADYKEPFYEDEIQDVLNPQKLVVPLPSVEEARHAESLKLSSIWYGIQSKPVYRQLCGHFLTCNSLNVVIREEFLQNPTILQNILKIAERPCDYIRTIEEVKPEDEIIYSTRSYLGCKAFFPSKYKDRKEIALGIKLARERLDCDNKSFFTFPSINHPSINNRKFVLLIFNKEGIVNKNNEHERSVNILVERKDIE